MALDDWADREADAMERPERRPRRARSARALGLASALAGAGLITAALASGRRALTPAELLARAV
ncbi:hypothetical protein [Nonomuraea dietziae]|uniref:hypothetical protein n=1 Tax=Nonomuraea dietziae TaxID=65515 RepID=UPI0033DAB86B